MTEGEVLELRRAAWVIDGITRKLNDVARSMSASTDELRALREELGIQPPPPQLRLVRNDDEADDDG